MTIYLTIFWRRRMRTIHRVKIINAKIFWWIASGLGWQTWKYYQWCHRLLLKSNTVIVTWKRNFGKFFPTVLWYQMIKNLVTSAPKNDASGGWQHHEVSFVQHSGLLICDCCYKNCYKLSGLKSEGETSLRYP